MLPGSDDDDVLYEMNFCSLIFLVEGRVWVFKGRVWVFQRCGLESGTSSAVIVYQTQQKTA